MKAKEKRSKENIVTDQRSGRHNTANLEEPVEDV